MVDRRSAVSYGDSIMFQLRKLVLFNEIVYISSKNCLFDSSAHSLCECFAIINAWVLSLTHSECFSYGY